jgi:hypothetical protein
MCQSGQESYAIFTEQKIQIANKVLANFSEKQQEDVLHFLLRFPENFGI